MCMLPIAQKLQWLAPFFVGPQSCQFVTWSTMGAIVKINPKSLNALNVLLRKSCLPVKAIARVFHKHPQAKLVAMQNNSAHWIIKLVGHFCFKLIQTWQPILLIRFCWRPEWFWLLPAKQQWGFNRPFPRFACRSTWRWNENQNNAPSFSRNYL